MVKVELLLKSAGKLIGNLVHGIHDSVFFFLCEGQREQFPRGSAIFQVLQLFQSGEMGISQFPDIIELRDDAFKCFRIFLLTACLPCGAFVLTVRGDIVSVVVGAFDISASIWIIALEVLSKGEKYIKHELPKAKRVMSVNTQFFHVG